MRPMQMRFVYLLYVSRSGSTMLANQIARQMPEVLVLPELDFVGLLFAHGDEYVSRLSPVRLHQLIRLDPKIIDIGLSNRDWRIILNASAGKGIKSLLTAISTRYAEYRGRQRPRVTVFQRGTLLSVAWDIVEIDPQALFLHIFRDPRAAISSIVGVRASRFSRFDRFSMGRADIIGLSRNWVKYICRTRELHRQFPERILEIQYEAFCLDKVSWLSRITRFIDVDIVNDMQTSSGLCISEYEKELHRNIDKAPIVGRIDAWREEFEPWRGYLVEKAVGELLAQKGYVAFFSAQVSVGKRCVFYTRGVVEFVLESIRPLLKRLRQAVLMPRATIRSFKRRLKDRFKGRRRGS